MLLLLLFDLLPKAVPLREFKTSVILNHQCCRGVSTPGNMVGREENLKVKGPQGKKIKMKCNLLPRFALGQILNRLGLQRSVLF